MYQGAFRWEDRADVWVHRRYLGAGIYEQSFEWRGREDGWVSIEPRFLARLTGSEYDGKLVLPDRVEFPEWTLVKVADTGSRIEVPFCAYYQRETTFWRSARLRWLLGHRLGRLKMRVIATLHIWGLADINSYELPSWSHVSVVRVLREVAG